MTTTIAIFEYWLNDIEIEVSPESSRFHFDATDNLYVVLEGSKTFQLLSPKYALLTDTVSPTYAVSPDGLPFQFNANHFIEYYRNHSHNRIENNTQQDLLLLEEIDKWKEFGGSFETVNNHFSNIINPEQSVELMDKLASITLSPGDMLYLPTGWFHKVTSRPFPRKNKSNKTHHYCENKHMAINFWWRAQHWEYAEQFERVMSQQLFASILN